MQGCLPLEGGGQGKDRQSLEMSIRSVSLAGAEADLHRVTTKFPDILGESLQHSMMGRRIPLNYDSCKNFPSCKSVQWQHVLHTSFMSKCIFNIYMSLLIMKRDNETVIKASWLSGWGIRQGSCLHLIPFCATGFLPLSASSHPSGICSFFLRHDEAGAMEAPKISNSLSSGSSL